MKRKTKYVICSLLLFFVSCDSRNRKLESQKDVVAAEKIIKNNLSYSPDLNNQIQDSLEKALGYLTKAIELDSLNGHAYKDKITVLTNLNRSIDTTTLMKLLRIEPDFAEGYIELGNIYVKYGNIETAKTNYEKAKQIYLNKPSTDLRNLNLIVIEFLITNDKNLALSKLQQYPIESADVKKAAISQIDEISKGRSGK